MKSAQKTFLDEIAHYIINECSAPKHTIIVLPSQRAISFLKKSIIEQSDKALFLPEMLTIDKVLDKFSPVQKLDGLSALFELYIVYCSIHYHPEDLDTFLSWGRTALSDFNAIDRYLVDPKQLFSYLNDTKAIELWNLDRTPLTNNEKAYLEFWENYGKLYHAFNEHCAELSRLTTGQQIRSIVENPITVEKGLTSTKKVIIGGLNALSSAEYKLIQLIQKKVPTELFWDADTYYLQDTSQEAGTFIRKNIAGLGKSKFNNIPSGIQSKKTVNIISNTTRYGQTKAVNQLLRNNYPNQDPTSTAVILNEQELLIPMLYQLPKNVDNANITMGYPVSMTPLANLVVLILDNFKNAKSSTNSSVFYHKYVFGLLNHPLLSYCRADKDFKLFNNKIVKSNKVYIGNGFIKDHFGNEIIQTLFPAQVEEKTIIQTLLKIMGLLKSDLETLIESDIEAQIKMEYLYHFTVALRKLLQRVEYYNFELSIKSLKNLILQEVNKQSIDFFGEPLSGLQIMGVLETRAIDFEHVVLLSVNEGIMPKGKVQNSFIPYDIAQQFGLPGYKEQDAIFAYYFYRLLQRSSKVDLLYYTSGDDFGKSGEESRYIQQLVKELENTTSVTIKRYNYVPSESSQQIGLQVQKSSATDEAFKRYLGNKVSPSAINTFLNCPLDFYNKYILGLKEESELEEEIDSSTFGTIVHETIEALFQEKCGSLLDIKFLSDCKKKYKEILDARFLHYFDDKQSVQQGPNRLHYEAANNFVKAYLDFEINNCKSGTTTELVKLEDVLEKEISFEIEQEIIPVHLFGKADRVAKVNGTFQVLDFKTGKVEQKDLNITDKNIEAGVEKINPKAFQLLLYGYAYALIHPELDLISASIFSFKNKNAGFIELQLNGKPVNKQDILHYTPLLLKEIIQKMLDKNEPIEHSGYEYCAYCLD